MEIYLLSQKFKLCRKKNLVESLGSTVSGSIGYTNFITLEVEYFRSENDSYPWILVTVSLVGNL